MSKKLKQPEEQSHVTLVKNAIKQAALIYEVEPSDVTKKMLLDAGLVSDWAMKRCGGLNVIKFAHFPVEDKDLKGIVKTKQDASYVNKLEKLVGVQGINDDLIKETLNKIISPVPKLKSPKKLKKTKKTREVVAMLNDYHIGLIVDSEEVNGTNSFDFKEAGRRIAYYVREVADYKAYARKDVNKLHLVLNGDGIAGNIHSMDTKSVHLIIHQMNASIHMLTHCIQYLSQYFPEIEIHGLSGNHSRHVNKNHGKRAVVEVYDSFENIIYYALSAAFRNNKNISFNLPKSPYGFINLPAGRAMFAHGDHIFSKALGNPGSVINVKSLSTAIKDFNAGEISKGNDPVKLILFGHTHCFAHFITNDGVEVYNAPSLVGLDQFAHSLTINNNFIAQVVFESTNKYILGDSRLVRLNDADKDASLDTIIPEYKKELKWKK